MNQYDIAQALLKLIPDVRCSVHSLESTCIDDNEDQHIRCGFRISWSRLNTVLCPSEEEILQAHQEILQEIEKN